MAERYSAIDALRDGTRIEIRAQTPGDRDAMLDLVDRMGEKSRYYRFFSPKRSFSEAEIAHFMNVDFTSHVALVAVVSTGGTAQIVGGGRYFVAEPGDAEIAFAVDDAYQGKGIASVLIRHLAAIARKAGLDTFHADVLPENAPMLKVFEKCGLAMSSSRQQGVVHATLRL